MDRALVLLVLLGYVDTALAECDSCNVGGIAAGCVFGTLALVGIIALIIWLVNRRKKKKAQLEGANEVKSGKTNQTYENRGYERDIEAGISRNTQSTPAISPEQYKEKGFGGYMECKEYESPKKNQHAHVSNGHTLGSSNRVKKKLTPLFKTPLQLQKAGSHGSLDNNFPLQDTVTVPLLSQDIIGLGFNIQGSISDGIYVREVHNRGPAKESGAIQPGDRIMSVTIGFENMVHEDALTILSYASPYPVSLELQKPVQTSLTPATPSEDGKDLDNLNHPVYRSQSYDDVSKITDNEKWIGPRRTWSEMKRGHPMKQSSLEEDQMGSLKKWGATHNIVGQDFNKVTCDVEMNQQSSSDSINVVEELGKKSGDISGDLAVLNKSLNSGGDVSLNLEDVEGIELDDMEDKANDKLDKGELKIDMDDVDANTSDMLDGLSAEDKLDMIKLSYEDPDSVREDDVEEHIKQDVQTEVQMSSPTNQLEVSAEIIGETQHSLDTPETLVVIETEAEQARNIKNKLDMITSSIDSDISPSSSASEKENNQDFVVDVPDILIKDESNSLQSPPTDINKNSIDIPNFETEKSSQLLEDAINETSDVNLPENVDSKYSFDDKMLPTFNIARNDTNDSMAVNVDNSVANLDDSDIMQKEQDDSDEEEEKNMVRSVLKDYFGDKASLLEQFGFEDGEVQVENDGKKESSISSLSSSPDSNEQQEQVNQTDSPLIQKKSHGGMSFEINAFDFNRMPDESKETPRGKKAKGGMSYFVGIDDKENASLTDPVYYEPPLTTEMPALIKPDEKERAVTPDLFSFDPPSLDITSLRLDTLTMASISNKEKEVNGKSSMESTPVGSPPQDTETFSSSDRDIKVDVKARSTEENVVTLSAGGVELNDSTA